MGAELLTAAPPAARPVALTRRASLTAVASLLDYAAKAVVGLVVTPILVSGLGRTLFGMWEMLSRVGTYMTVTDGRPTEALRLLIAQRQDDPDEAAKRRTVGAGLIVWLLMMPVVIAVGGAFAWWIAPALTKADPSQVGDVRLTGLLIVLMFLFSSLAEIPESVLRGMNLGYRRMGLQASLNLVGGALAAAAVWLGLGLAGQGLSQVVRALATGVCFFLLVRRYVPWFAAARPTRAEVKAVFGMSAWLTLGDGIAKVLTGSDVIILGAVMAPAAVTTYALTSYAARMAIGIHMFAAGAAMPGMGGLMGQGQRARAARARRELMLLTWLFSTTVGAAILFGNRAFLSLWVGGQNYAGLAVDALIVLGTIQTLFIRVDAYVLDAALKPRQRVVVSAFAALLMVALCVALTRQFGLLGLAAGAVLGRMVQTVAYPLLVRADFGVRQLGAEAGDTLRLAAISVLLMSGAAALGARLTLAGWPAWVAAVGAATLIAFALALLLGPAPEARRALTRRLVSMIPSGASS